MRALDLSAFPRAQDFVVEATDVQVGDGADREWWTNLRYVVPSWGIDVNFPWWERSTQQMREWTPADAPCGSIESPYIDRDQGWGLFLWQTGVEIFIMEGDGSQGYDDPPVYQTTAEALRDGVTNGPTPTTRTSTAKKANGGRPEWMVRVGSAITTKEAKISVELYDLRWTGPEAMPFSYWN